MLLHPHSLLLLAQTLVSSRVRQGKGNDLSENRWGVPAEACINAGLK